MDTYKSQFGKEAKSSKVNAIADKLIEATHIPKPSPLDQQNGDGTNGVSISMFEDAMGRIPEPLIGLEELVRAVSLKIRERERVPPDRTPKTPKAGGTNESTVQNSKLSPAEVIEEIEEVLDLAEMCQWMLTVRRLQWASRIRDYAVSAVAKCMNSRAIEPQTEDERKLKEQIVKADFPVPYPKGLAIIGISGDNITDRHKKFRDFFIHRASAFCSSYSGDKTLPEIVDAYFSQIQDIGWKDADSLFRDAIDWQNWWKRAFKEKKSKAGQKGGKARKTARD